LAVRAIAEACVEFRSGIWVVGREEAHRRHSFEDGNDVLP
jgi:hypothetical protein